MAGGLSNPGSPHPQSECVTLALHAMATRFEFVLHGPSRSALQSAGEEALREIQLLEGQLSFFIPTSEIAHINARAAREPVRVSPRVFGLLERAQRLYHETGGAFDITIAPLMRCWGFRGGAGRIPSPDELAAARSRVGMELVLLDAAQRTVRLAREGVMLDLGAIGKGYAIESAAEILRENGVASALLHGGTSTVQALGRPPGEEGWTVAVYRPPDLALPGVQESDGSRRHEQRAGEAAPEPLAMIQLRDEAMSVSAVWGRAFEIEGKLFGHVIDPRSGRPAGAAVLAAVAVPSATDSDGLSTALLICGPERMETLAGLRPGMRTLVATQTAEGLRTKCAGPAPGFLKSSGVLRKSLPY